MNGKGWNALIIIAFLLFAVACNEQDIKLSGKIYNQSANKEEDLELKLYLIGEADQIIQHKHTALREDGLFGFKVRSNRSYILEIIGEQGAGRVFLSADRLNDKIDITYPVIEKIVILHTNDRHFDLNQQDELTKMLEETRARYDDVFLFDAGDVFVKHAHRWIVNYSTVKDTAWYGERAMQMIQKMNELGYDLMTLGNHEFAYINNHTRIALEAARFPILAANIEITTDKLPLPDPYKMLKTSTMRRIAVLGLSNNNTIREGVRELDLNQTIKEYLPLKDSSDVFVILSHLGLQKDILLANDFSVIDAIIGGHTHDLLEESLVENSVLIAHAGGNLHFVSDTHPVYLGKVIFTLENGKVIDKSGLVIRIDSKP